MTGFSSTLILLGLVLLGAGVGWQRPFSQKLADKLMFLNLFFLLILMGFSTARVPDIELHWSVLSTTAILGSTLPLLGTWFVQFLGHFLLPKSKTSPTMDQQNTEPVQPPCLICLIRFPLVLIALTVLGFILGWRTKYLFSFNSEIALDIVLFLLVFMVGYNFGFTRKQFFRLLLNWRNFVFPLLTIVGSLSSAFLISPLTGWKLSESLALVSGMGWYSLSSGLITSLGNPLLGTAAFLSNLLRESFSLLMIPALLRLEFRSGAVGSPGAASMDVALPVLEKFGGVEIVPLALVHGLIVTGAVPILVLLWMNLGF